MHVSKGFLSLSLKPSLWMFIRLAPSQTSKKNLLTRQDFFTDYLIQTVAEVDRQIKDLPAQVRREIKSN